MAKQEGGACASLNPVGDPYFCSELPVPAARAGKPLLENTGRTWCHLWVCLVPHTGTGPWFTYLAGS